MEHRGRASSAEHRGGVYMTGEDEDSHERASDSEEGDGGRDVSIQRDGSGFSSNRGVVTEERGGSGVSSNRDVVSRD